MTELIKIEPSRIGGEAIQTCNARDLHAFLEVKARFNDWIRNRVEDFGFQENQDFITLTRLLVSGGKRKDYYLSLDMAKELAMVERNAKGKEAAFTSSTASESRNRRLPYQHCPHILRPSDSWQTP